MMHHFPTDAVEIVRGAKLAVKILVALLVVIGAFTGGYFLGRATGAYEASSHIEKSR